MTFLTSSRRVVLDLRRTAMRGEPFCSSLTRAYFFGQQFGDQVVDLITHFLASILSSTEKIMVHCSRNSGHPKNAGPATPEATTIFSVLVDGLIFYNGVFRKCA